MPRAKPILILTVGLPYSGKTRWARLQGHPIVCPDSIRVAMHGQRFASAAEPFVWVFAHMMVRALFLAGHDTVILDACNNTAKRRHEWKSASYQRQYHVLDVPFDLCHERALAAGDYDVMESITRMASAHESIQPHEWERDGEGA